MVDLGKSYETLDPVQVASNYAPDTFAHAFELPYNWDTNGGEHRETLEKTLARISDLKFSLTDDIQTWRRHNRVFTVQGVHISGKWKDGLGLEFGGRPSAMGD